MRVIFLTIFAILAASCSSTHLPIGTPACKKPIPVTPQIWNDIDLLREAMSHNQLVDQECIEKLRKRIELHDAHS